MGGDLHGVGAGGRAALDESAVTPPKEANERWPTEHKLVWMLASCWLLFLISPLARVLGSDQAIVAKVVGCVIILTFGTLFSFGYHHYGMGSQKLRPQLAVLAGLIVLTSLLIPIIGVEAAATSPFILSYASFALPPRLARVIGPALLVTVVAVLATTTELVNWWPILITDAVLVVFGTVTGAFVQHIETAEERERDRLVLSERDRMARDVHDLLGHSLTIIALKTQLVERLMDSDPGRARSELAEIRAITGEALVGVRQTVDDIRATGLATELALARSSLAAGGVTVRIVGDPAVVPERLDAPLAWLTREATTNILRHARATAMRIDLLPTSARFDDDGRGGECAEGNGIRGMRERLERVGASLDVGPSATGGVCLEVTW